ncbi:hypothetical protein GCM10010425_49420 [Streptomyces spororaveus]|uniref:Uncharacterized protein n=1 Tax=Streptomyces spororaveus TaxID=284039 RepID=A0ABQ3T2B9_9ACTN|nr:hypothetical protein [Streptomyces spororaveus]GHI74536.1 hypothetical protein Sspor_00970 [Streptomyces spororaveus]
MRFDEDVDFVKELRASGVGDAGVGSDDDEAAEPSGVGVGGSNQVAGAGAEPDEGCPGRMGAGR